MARNWTIEIQLKQISLTHSPVYTYGLANITGAPTAGAFFGEGLPLDEAVYEPLSNKIYGVRGQYIYRFNASTAEKEAELRYYSRGLGTAEIVALNGSLYIAPKNFQYLMWDGNSGGFAYPSYNMPSFGYASPDKDIFVVDTGLFTTTRKNGNITVNGITRSTAFHQHYFDMVAVTGFLGTPTGRVWGDNNSMQGWTFSGLTDLRITGLGFSTDQMVYDPTNSILWTVNARFYDIWMLDLKDWNSGTFAYNDAFATGAEEATGPFQAFGITYSPSANAAYAVFADSRIARISGEQAVAALRLGAPHPSYQFFDLGITGANPVRIQACPYAYHPYSGKALIPTWNTDQIIVWDCLTNTVSSTKNGFYNPVDVVFTPTSAFAIQDSATGLKEIL